MNEFEDHNINKEYTLSQHKLHLEFLDLFESLIEKFLESEGYSIDNFCTKLKRKLSNSKAEAIKLKNKDEFAMLYENSAVEIMEVISVYMNFESWAKMVCFIIIYFWVLNSYLYVYLF